MPKKLILLFIIAVMAPLQSANGEVKHDGSLGTSGNVQGPNYSIEAAMGKQMGSSLFHSFEKFDINTGENATFKGPSDVERIISRVTGGNPSRIDGAIRSEIQGADFYFINPFGMIFGPNASLDITGSFFATSADYVKLGENGRFDARNPENTVLTADAPEAFGFLGQKPGDIIVEARRESDTNPLTGIMEYSGLEVNGESRIMIAGGGINIDGGWIKTTKGDLDLISISSKGELIIDNPVSDKFSTLGKIEVNNNGSARTEDGGNLSCLADEIRVLSGSDMVSMARYESDKAGDVVINARNSVFVSGDYPVSNGYTESLISGIGSFSDTLFCSDAGNLILRTGDLILEDGGIVTTSGFMSGNSGDITLDVSSLKITDGGGLITSNYMCFSSLFGREAKSGSISINASESISISGENKNGQSQISSRVISSDGTDGGSISINSPEIRIENGGIITSSSERSGNSGGIEFGTKNLSVLNGGSIDASINGGTGQAGNININASESVTISGKDSLSTSQIISKASNSESSFGGNISVSAPDVLIEKSGTVSTSSQYACDSGNISFTGERLSLLDGGFINTSVSNGFGKAGDISIKASDSIVVSQNKSLISAMAMYSSSFSGGNISLDSPVIKISETARISCITEDSGPAGNIAFKCDEFSLSDHSFIMTSANASDGGSISIDCKDYFQMNLGGISTSVHGGEGNGGNILIKRPRISTLYRSEIVADAHGGNGGNMDISSGFFIRDIYSIISASSALGIDGNIVIDSPEIDLNSGLIKLAEEYQDPASFIKDPCIERMSGKSSSLTNGSAIIKPKSPFEYFESGTQRY